ncbi:proline-rich transmembrane protein 1-like [Acropora muricata]|uniref:proline-rich transmembrane protein 1-like n=1 Tax=Acropora muricata TaxID=159855 RepID=UPI0034E5DBE4
MMAYYYATGTGHVASQYPSDPRSPFPEQPSYVVYAPGQPISAWSPNNATLPGHQSPPSEPVENRIIREPSQETPIPDYSALSWIAFSFCCWPIGLIAVYKSSQVQSYLASGDRDSAIIASAAAKKYAQIAIYVGTALFVVSVVVGVVFSASS